jgi:hypothetical protein
MPRSDRDYPLDTARARCSWHVGGTAGQNDEARTGGDGSHHDRMVRPVLGDHRVVGKPFQMAWQLFWSRSALGRDRRSGPPWPRRGLQLGTWLLHLRSLCVDAR